MRHPWACQPLMSRVNVGPAMVRYVDSTLGVLREAGFSVELADHAWNATDSHIYGLTIQRLSFPFAPQEVPEAAETHEPALRRLSRTEKRPATRPHRTLPAPAIPRGLV